MTTARIYPKHTNEALFFWNMRQESVLCAISDVCVEFFRKYQDLPDIVFVNHLLMKQFDKEIQTSNLRQLCVAPEDVVWFYSSEESKRLLPHAQYVVVAHTQMPGKSCSL